MAQGWRTDQDGRMMVGESRMTRLIRADGRRKMEEDGGSRMEDGSRRKGNRSGGKRREARGSTV
eukprot:1112916-Rhodomonas_salina.2